MFCWLNASYNRCARNIHIDCAFLSCHIRIQSVFTLCNCLNIKELIAQSKRNIRKFRVPLQLLRNFIVTRLRFRFKESQTKTKANHTTLFHRVTIINMAICKPWHQNSALELEQELEILHLHYHKIQNHQTWHDGGVG